MTDTLKPVSPLNHQIILKNLGLYLSCSSNERYVYLTDAIFILWEDIGDEFLKEKCKEKNIDYDKMRIDMLRLQRLMERSKEYYDKLEDKTFRKKDLDKEIRKYYIETGSKIALLHPNLFKIFYFLSSHSTICRSTVRNEDLKLLEHQGMRKMLLGSTKPASSPPPENVTISKE